uniref:Uncharacterized protein n=1 Tax=Amorphochlora amoebiformis TaxID=1561963 RepID=A0A7S0DPM6_9EUKA|mmetsp:Transcript_5088/g.7703  ORF Transcript_5088/g.7703 Transcript_5088/m.7703 type:complete len:170 (+) Transcript_5088:246-755(+)
MFNRTMHTHTVGLIEAQERNLLEALIERASNLQMELIGHVIDLFDDPEALGKSNENSKAYEVFFKQKPTLYHTDRVVLALATLAKMARMSELKKENGFYLFYYSKVLVKLLQNEELKKKVGKISLTSQKIIARMQTRLKRMRRKTGEISMVFYRLAVPHLEGIVSTFRR